MVKISDNFEAREGHDRPNLQAAMMHAFNLAYHYSAQAKKVTGFVTNQDGTHTAVNEHGAPVAPFINMPEFKFPKP